ncbi:MAG: hypothetical protein NTW31_08475 [Bacteroidetes bacterium]|nr:hypothetical protein [Bacteroidota bacterium]
MNLIQSFTRIPSSPRSIDAVNRQQEQLLKLANSMGLKSDSEVFLRIFKELKELEVWIKKDKQYVLFKIYPICYVSGTLGTKTRVGDNQAPEGFYEIRPSSMNPASNYHLAFNIGYPNAYEKAKKYTGSEIMCTATVFLSDAMPWAMKTSKRYGPSWSKHLKKARM